MSRVSHLLNSSAEIWRATQVDDGYGGWVETWSPLSTVRARASQPSASDRTAGTGYRADQETADLSWVVYVEPGTDVRMGDEVHIRGSVLKIISVFEPSVPGTYLRLDCSSYQINSGAGSQ